MQLPLALEHAARRKEALLALRDLLNAAAVDSAFLQQALPCLTAQEVVHLLNWAEAATAHIKSSWYGSPTIPVDVPALKAVVGMQHRLV